jgi:hypothetical protein
VNGDKTVPTVTGEAFWKQHWDYPLPSPCTGQRPECAGLQQGHAGLGSEAQPRGAGQSPILPVSSGHPVQADDSPARPLRLTNRSGSFKDSSAAQSRHKEDALMMDGSRATPSFACTTCGSPSITVPDEIHDAANLSCAGCGAGAGSWLAFKERIRQAILHEIASGKTLAEQASSDIPIRCLQASAGYRPGARPS